MARKTPYTNLMVRVRPDVAQRIAALALAMQLTRGQVIEGLVIAAALQPGVRS